MTSAARSPLELRPMTRAFIEAVLDDRREDAAAELGIELPAIFPTEDDRGFLRLRLRQMRDDSRFETWCPFAMVVEGRMVGHAGYHGPPGVNSTRDGSAVEFGYQTFPDHRGRGYATEATRMLMDLAEERGVHRFVLAIRPDNEPSLAIIRKFGYVKTGEAWDEEDGLEHVFELDRSRASSV